MNTHMNQMTSLEERVLTAIVHGFGATIFDLNSLLGLNVHLVYAQSEIKLGLIGLCKKNWVVRMRRLAGERVFCVPYERYIEHMMKLSSDVLSHLSPVIAHHSYEECECAGKDIVMDMIIMLGWANLVQPRFNKKGQLDKKLIEPMLKQVKLEPDRLIAFIRNDTMKLPYPIALAVLIDFGSRLGILRIVDGQLLVQQQQLMEWLELNPAERNLQLYHLWVKVHYPEQPIIQQLLIILPMLQSNKWFLITDLLGNYDGSSMNTIEEYLIAIEELGWARVGRTLDGSLSVFSLIGIDENLQKGSQDGDWYVQPDFEIIVNPFVSYSEHYQLNMYATLISRNQMYTYHITKESSSAAFQRGWTADRIINHLQSLARYGVPENIHISILDWDKRYRGVQIETIVTLRCETVAIAEQLMKLPDVARILNEDNRLLPQLFLIPAEDVDFIREKMTAYGYVTDRKGAERQANMQVFVEQESNHGVFHSRLRFDMYKRDEQHPEITSLYPGIADVPSNWMNAYIPYHLSTRKQLLEQAIKWQCYVLVLLNGNNTMIAPISITTEHSITLVLNGLCEGNMTQIPLINMEALQLIVPGIHDLTKYMSTIV